MFFSLICKGVNFISFIMNILSIIIYIKNKYEIEIINMLKIELIIATFLQTVPLFTFPKEESIYLKVFQAFYSGSFNLTISLITTFIAISVCISIFYQEFFVQYSKLLTIIFSFLSWILTIFYSYYLFKLKSITCSTEFFCFYEIKKDLFPIIIHIILFILNITSNIIMIIAIHKLIQDKELKKGFLRQVIGFISGSFIFYGPYFIAIIPLIFHLDNYKGVYNLWNSIRILFFCMNGLFVSVFYIYSKSSYVEIWELLTCKKNDNIYNSVGSFHLYKLREE